VVKDYQGWQDIALGLSTAFAVQQFNPQNDLPIRWAFIKSTRQLQTELSEFTLWHIGTLHTKQMNAIALESTSQKTGVKTVMTCVETKPVQQEMGVQSQPFRCR
jgi:hypothetical protein